MVMMEVMMVVMMMVLMVEVMVVMSGGDGDNGGNINGDEILYSPLGCFTAIPR